jgi:mannose-6-phosphate isomerase-like protein (cupin superfamily)
MAERLRVGSDEMRIHVRGPLLAADVRMPAGGGPGGLHRHEPTEIDRVSDGELTIYREGDDGEIERIVAAAGEIVAIPGGREHTVRNESAEPATAYVVYAPGEPMERFVRAAAELAAAGPPAIADVFALAERHGIEMTRPIPGG